MEEKEVGRKMGKVMERNLVLLLIIACVFTVMSMSGNTYALYVK